MQRKEIMEVWSQFAKRVSGEWNGFGADFSIEGKPFELPDLVVPEAYKAWDVKVFDWQTQCPTLAEPSANRDLEYKSIQLFPTVGCDAATPYSIENRKVGGANSGVSAFAYQSSGSYIAVWRKKDSDLLEVEYCLNSPQDFKSRVRIIQLFNVSDSTKMVLQRIKVFCEHWYGPFRNGDQLEACTIRNSAFASTAPMTASEVAGIWRGSRAVATFDASNTENFRELLDDKEHRFVRDCNSNILLPKKLWCSLKQNNNDETISEVGWVLDTEQAITSSCLFSSTAMLKEISLSLETKAKDI